MMGWANAVLCSLLGRKRPAERGTSTVGRPA